MVYSNNHINKTLLFRSTSPTIYEEFEPKRHFHMCGQVEGLDHHCTGYQSDEDRWPSAKGMSTKMSSVVQGLSICIMRSLEGRNANASKQYFICHELGIKSYVPDIFPTLSERSHVLFEHSQDVFQRSSFAVKHGILEKHRLVHQPMPQFALVPHLGSEPKAKKKIVVVEETAHFTSLTTRRFAEHAPSWLSR